MAAALRVNEIFIGIQGESTHIGKTCVFVRLTGCNLRCSYCDTKYAYDEGADMTLDEIAARVAAFRCRTVEITGGEPLLQSGTIELARRLAAEGHDTLVETNGTVDVSGLPPEAIKVMDIKCPGSGESGRNRLANVEFLTPRDNVKFVITDRADYEWAREILTRLRIPERCEALFSPAAGRVEPRALAEWMIADALPARFQPQLHKILWGDERGR